MTPSTISRGMQERGRRAPAILTERGAATVALLRLERAWAALAPADRAYFAETLTQLAGEAGGARRVA
jgi:hypothetical protein